MTSSLARRSAVQATIELHELFEDAGSDGGGVATDGSATDGSATDAASDGADAAPDATARSQARP